MGYKRTPSEYYSNAWTRYKEHCDSVGLVPLNRFCATHGVDVQRLYEWLRRRKISISEYQSHFSDGDVSDYAESPGFREVRLGPSLVPARARQGHPGHAVRDIRIETGGISVHLPGMGLDEIADLLIRLRVVGDVGS